MSEEEVLKRLAEIRGNINELQKYHSDEWIMREVLASMALSKDAPMTLTNMPRPWSEGDMKRPTPLAVDGACICRKQPEWIMKVNPDCVVHGATRPATKA